MGSEGHLEGIWGPSRDRSGGSILGPILGQFWSILDPILGIPQETSRISFIWPWVGPLARNILNMGPGMGLGGYPV